MNVGTGPQDALTVPPETALWFHRLQSDRPRNSKQDEGNDKFDVQGQTDLHEVEKKPSQRHGNQHAYEDEWNILQRQSPRHKLV